ncbi:MAG TPA: class I SAM-dependent methyltransferase [Candidatus Acidoferrales bacterium]|nr:class I SAM-dependent methyltransferase [Candidatus Acidoferrales bacterium]
MQVADLGSVQKTLLLPLWGRAVESRKPHPMLVDETAVRIAGEIGYDFSTIAAGMSPITQMAWVVRCVHTDRTVREFLARCPDATVVNLGCGLDTTFERVDNGRVRWFDLDLPDVIGLRRRFIHESERRRFLASSLLETSWLESVDRGRPMFFAALGVLYYIPEDRLRAFLKTIAGAIPAGELLFDACSATGLRIANQRVIRAGGMSESAALVWSIEDARELERWDERIGLMESYPLFRGMKHGRSLKQKWGMFMADTLRVMSMVRLRVGAGI